MNNDFTQQDTICAMATAPGGAIGVIRVSGADAIAIADRCFRSAGQPGATLAEAKPYTLHYGSITDRDGNTIDDVLVSVFRAPRSYTGEDSVEISCHGSRYVLGQVLQRLTDNGCRQAEPGEYTRRAYMNGKLDLSQAEAVADLIASTNRATHRMAMSQLRGHFSSELSVLREQLLKLTSLLELELDFSDHEELEFADRSELQALAVQIDKRITSLASSFETGNALKKGIPVAIVGKTNVGKSTLLNRLLHEEKAIVSDIHGTTRDVIEDTMQIDGITFRFIDTAGLRQTDDLVENLGIERTYQKLQEAAIVLWVIDQQPTDDEVSEMKAKTEGKKLIIVRNKVDLDGESEEQKVKNEKFNTDGIELSGNASLYSVPMKLSSSEQLNSSPFILHPSLINNSSPFILHSSLINNSSLFILHSSLINISAKQGTGIDTLQAALVRAADIPEITENDVIVTSARHYEALTRAHEALSRVLEGMSLGLSGDLLAEDLRLALHDLAEITGGEIVTDEVLGNIFKHFCVGK